MKMQKTVPTVYSPSLRGLDCRWKYKGSTFSSVILRPWVLTGLGLELSTFRTTDWRSANWAKRCGGSKLTVVKIYICKTCWAPSLLVFQPASSHSLSQAVEMSVKSSAENSVCWCVIKVTMFENASLRTNGILAVVVAAFLPILS